MGNSSLLRGGMSTALVIVFMLLCVHPLSVSAEDKVTFNFVDVDLTVVAKYVSEITGKNFIFDDTFKGKVTIIAPSKLNARDAFRLFTSVLELKKFTVAPSGVNAYKIIPTSLARQKGLQVKEKGFTVNESYIVRLIPFKYISAEEAVNFFKPIVSRDGHISSFGPGNLILIIDSGLNIRKILSIAEAIDQPSTVEAPEIVFLKHAGADDVAKIINEGIQQGAGVRRKGGVQTTGKVVADTRLNAVVIFGPKEERESLKRLIAILDVPSEEEQGRINVYFLENADAEEVAKVMQGVIRGVQQAKLKQKARVKAVGRTQQDIIVTPDKSTNSLVIISSPAEYRSLSSIIKKLDKRKKQVYVEAMIVEASIDDLLDVGARWRFIATHNGDPVLIGGMGIMDQSALQSVVSGLTGFSAGGLGNFLDIPITTVSSSGTVGTTNLTVPGFAALFSLQVFKGVVNVLSTPQILTSDNEEAEIIVGENVPFITKRESDPSRTLSVFSNIERQDVGIKLTITPQIAEGDYVNLEVYQEISSVKQEANADILLSVGPTTTKRSTKTSVVVKDKQTVVIGGLMQEKRQETVTKVPLLGDIPLLGWLFKFKNKTKQKTNLLVFLTPHIIRDSEDLSDLTHNKGTEYARSQNMYAPGQILVRFNPGVTKERIESILKEEEAFIIAYIEKLDVYVVGIPVEEDIEDAVGRFLSIEDVRFAEPNYQFRIDAGRKRYEKSRRNDVDIDYRHNVTGAIDDGDD